MHDSPGWAKASLEFKGSLLGFATDWLILNMDEVLRVCCAVVYGSAQTIRVVSQIYRERTMEEVSANKERLTSSNLIRLIG